MSTTLTGSSSVEIRTFGRRDMAARAGCWEGYVASHAPLPLSYHPSWPQALGRGLGHVPYCIEATDGDGRTRGLLPLALVRSRLFGRYLVGLPYLNYGGVLADDEATAHKLAARAIDLADRLDVRHLELRHEAAIGHPALATRTGPKVNMRRPLPATAEELWADIPSSVRNQVRKGQKSDLSVSWGGEELLPEFYAVFSRNMRDLGTPVYGRSLFRAVVRQFPGRAEFCVVRAGAVPAAAALLVHGWGVTEVPSASSLRAYNPTCCNMLMYWNLLERAVRLGQGAFDFGRCTPGGGVFRFKRQWGALPSPAAWQVYARSDRTSDVRPDNPRYQRLIHLWQRLPVGLTRLIGPPIVRGIP